MTKATILAPHRTVDSAALRTPILWRHAHLIGAYVLEDPQGQLFLLFARYEHAAWERRVRWRCGVDLLMPAAVDHAMLLERLGYSRQAHGGQRTRRQQRQCGREADAVVAGVASSASSDSSSISCVQTECDERGI